MVSLIARIVNEGVGHFTLRQVRSAIDEAYAAAPEAESVSPKARVQDSLNQCAGVTATTSARTSAVRIAAVAGEDCIDAALMLVLAYGTTLDEGIADAVIALCSYTRDEFGWAIPSQTFLIQQELAQRGLVSLAFVNGVVTDSDGQGVAGACVFLLVAPTDNWDASTAPCDPSAGDGSYSIAGVPAGRYAIGVQRDDAPQELFNLVRSAAGWTNELIPGADGVVDVASAPISLDVVLPPLVTVSGGSLHYSDPSSLTFSPLAGYGLGLPPPGGFQTFLDSNGNWSTSLLAGQYAIWYGGREYFATLSGEVELNPDVSDLLVIDVGADPMTDVEVP